MTQASLARGASAVGFVDELPVIEAGAVAYLRMWFSGTDTQSKVWTDFASTLGPLQGRRALKSFEALLKICVDQGRRPLMYHALTCKCVGSDEACFANLIAASVDGDREDAMLIATLIVRPDMAPSLIQYATDFGLAMKRMLLLRDRQNRPKFQENHTIH